MKSKMEWFNNLMKHGTTRPDATSPSEETLELKCFHDAFMAVTEEYERAVAKHPFFAHTVFEPNADRDNATLVLEWHRSSLNTRVSNRNCSGVDVLECELAEAREAFTRGDYAHCYQELAQCGGIVVRMMLDVQKKLHAKAAQKEATHDA